MTRARFAFLLLVAMSSPASADNAKPLTTILLIARAELPDPNFKGSVVLVMNNIGLAPLGVIINRPTSIAVSRLFPDLERLTEHDKLYFGGPVEITTVSFLVRADATPGHATAVLDGVYISTNRELLRKLLTRDKPMEGLRIFIGRSGWAPGQLEAEIARGDWTLAPADAAAIFDGKSQHPWPERQMPDGVQRTFYEPDPPTDFRSIICATRRRGDIGIRCQPQTYGLTGRARRDRLQAQRNSAMENE